MTDLLDLATAMVARATSGEDIEAYVTHERTFQVKAYSGEVESLASAEPRGAGARLIRDHRVGFAYTTDLSDSGLDAVVDRARDNSRHATSDEATGVAPAWSEEPPEISGLVDRSQSDVHADDKVAFVLELERATRAQDPRIRAVEEAVYSDSEAEVGIATSSGVAGSYRRTDAWCYALAIATEGDDTEIGFEFDLARGLAALDADDVARRSAQRALEILGASKIPSGRMSVVFEPYVSAQFLGVLGSALTGEAVQKGRSLFAGKVGTRVAGEGVHLVDDGRLEGAPGSAPWDGEGVPTGRTGVISSGVLESFLYDTTSARREGRDSTGNASRASFKGVPHPSPTNLALAGTGESPDQIYDRAGKALLVQDFHGVHSGANAVSGDFSVGATGRLLQNGELGAAVKEVTIAAPMLEILKGIQAVGSDLRWLPFGGSFGGATTLIAEMTIAGL
jgi:PmbA protein